MRGHLPVACWREFGVIDGERMRVDGTEAIHLPAASL
jgi:hypothetical protein